MIIKHCSVIVQLDKEPFLPSMPRFLGHILFNYKASTSFSVIYPDLDLDLGRRIFHTLIIVLSKHSQIPKIHRLVEHLVVHIVVNNIITQYGYRLVINKKKINYTGRSWDCGHTGQTDGAPPTPKLPIGAHLIDDGKCPLSTHRCHRFHISCTDIICHVAESNTIIPKCRTFDEFLGRS